MYGNVKVVFLLDNFLQLTNLEACMGHDYFVVVGKAWRCYLDHFSCSPTSTNSIYQNCVIVLANPRVGHSIGICAP